jgi:hypothetical protein
MPTFLLGVFVVLSCLVALYNWRLGLLLAIAAGMLQDPVRKVAPGTPAYLTLSFLPIYFVMLGKLWSSVRLGAAVQRFYPQLRSPTLLFSTSLLASTAQTMSYGAAALALALLGLFSYAGGLPAVFLGFFLVRRDFRELDGPLLAVVILMALMLVGAPLEHFGYKFSRPWLGMVATKGAWRRWYSDTEWVEMISGFHRSPEIMGWHAATLVILCTYLMARRPALTLAWALLAAWGFSCVLLSGRRKMFLLVVIFLGVFLLLSRGRHRRVLVFCLGLAAVAGALLLPHLVDDRYVATAQSSLPSAGTRVAGHAFTGPLWLLGNVGLFGYGVGTKTQGAQHLKIDIDTPLMEGGLEKVMIEVGIAGTLALVLVFIALLRCVWVNFRRARAAGVDQTPLAALLAFVVANAATFLVAFQIYGDPLVVVLVGLALGVLLSGSRLAAQRQHDLRIRRHRTPLPAPALNGAATP